MSKITPDHAPHEQLVCDVEEWLAEQSFGTRSLAYHDVFGDNSAAAKRIGEMWDPTAIVMRHRSDRTAFHWKLPLAFWWEAKTKGRKPPRDETIYVDLCTLIAVHHKDPLLRTLFIHRNQHSGHEVGFWAHDVPGMVSLVKISRDKWGQGEIARWYERQARYIFGSGIIIRDHTGGGTHDPFIAIPHDTVMGLEHWKTLIHEAVAAVETQCLSTALTPN